MASLKPEKPSAAQPKQEPPKVGATPKTSAPSGPKAPPKKADPKPVQPRKKVTLVAMRVTTA